MWKLEHCVGLRERPASSIHAGGRLARVSLQSACIAALVAASGFAIAGTPGPGSDGNHTVAAGTTIVNAYSRLTTTVAAGASSIFVPDLAELALPAAACTGCVLPLGEGDRLLIYQAQGADISTANAVTYGSVDALGAGTAQVGRYEYVFVAGVIDNVGPDQIMLSIPADGTCTGLRNDYTVNAAAGGIAPPMVVRVPQYSNLTVGVGATVVPAEWNWDPAVPSSADLGGILAIDVAGTPEASTGVLTLNGSLSANGRGFRGGFDALPAVTLDGVPQSEFVTNNAVRGAGKGESIVGTFVRYDALGGRYGRGAPANGGGGGNSHNGAGGGGSNGGILASWTNGRGVRDPNAAFNAAWLLDNEVAPGGILGDDSGGGRGGYGFGNSDQDALTVAPGNAAWTGDFRRIIGGLGGRPLDRAGGTQPYERIFFGGGGGSGETNNRGIAQTQGVDGGGIVFLTAREVAAASTGTIEASGLDAANTTTVGPGDAPGGGGGGGTIVVNIAFSQSLPAAVTLRANGGRGGTQEAASVPAGESEGGAGGGGGGVVLLSNFGASEFVAGGANGTSGSTAVTEFTPNGGTSGNVGNIAFGPERNGPSSPFICLQAPNYTTPVTNAYFQAQRLSNGNLRVRFDSASEIAHAGYFVVAGSDRRRVSDFVPASGASSDAKAYEVTIPDQGNDDLFLVDIDIQGREIFRGPFRADVAYGAPATIAQYDWSTSRNQLASYQSSARGAGGNIARVAARNRGMQRVTFEQLLTAGIDLSGTPATSIAVVSESGAVSRRVRGNSNFGPGSSIEFFGDVKATLWSRDRFYLIKPDAALALQMALVSPTVAASAVSSYTAKLVYAPQNAYYEASPVGDPWYADQLRSQGSVATKQITLSGPAALGAGELEVVVWGGIDWPGSVADHHIRVRMNGTLVASERFDGLASQTIRVPVQLGAGAQQISIEAPGDNGQPADIVYIESATLTYPAATRGDGSSFFGQGLQGTASDTIFKDGVGDAVGAPIAGTITIDQIGGTNLRAYRVLAGHATEFVVSGSPMAFYADGFPSDAEMWVLPSAQMITPTISVAANADGLLDAPAKWVAITHGMFTPALNDLVTRRESEGLTTKVVNVESIYTRYSAGNPTPDALRAYIRDAKNVRGAEYIVLVGADTTDAPGHAGSGSVSFVPTPYSATSLFVRYAPSDPLLADTDGDRQPDVALGRLPVRTLAEAQEAVRKILAYENQAATSTAMLVAGPVDNNLPRAFATASEDLSAELPNVWTVDRVYQDLVGLNPARQAIVNGFNSGRSVISYIGHSGPSVWSGGSGPNPLFDISQVMGTSVDPNRPNLAASANQPIVLQFACWTTYFVSASQNTMAQALLLTPNRGASAIVGATVLLDQISHDRMAAAVASRLVPGARIGDVIQAAKIALANDAQDPAGPEILLGQVLLGDPAQAIQ